MDLNIFQRIQVGIDEKRHTLTEFLETASEAEKDTCLCTDETCIQNHLQVIETSLGQIGTNTLGLCEVCHGTVETALLEMDYTAHVCLDHYSEDERRRLESELELSQVIQRALLPQRVPVIPGIELAAFSRPADIIGGDYFDFFKFRDGSHGVVIADISGHGVSAAMLMGGLQTAIQTLAPDTDSPAEILSRINRFYIHNINFTTFVTVFLAKFDLDGRSLTYVNSGHNPPAVFRRSEKMVKWLTRTAPAVGLDEHYSPKMDSVNLASGDVFLLYTDGLTEALNHQMEEFGAERLSAFLQNAADLSAADMLQIFIQGVHAHGGSVSLADDLTLVAMKVSK